VPGQKRKKPAHRVRGGLRRASQATRDKWCHLTFLATRKLRAGGHKLKHSRGLGTANASNDDIMRGVFRTMRSRDHNVVVVRRTINLGDWEFGMGRGWEGVEKGEVSLRVT
jgi:hypothetical protein